eukprot:TRINITY_DN1744_c0_g1_i2.p1 TRINITY_DN1744_c0_g1~~TRINITY_DN1744_c0_g1_i2.p1  ORF type:complete len:188 (+),score=36.83 TRINITY_DN1744_c0_g1_i2:3-566(+)
MLSLKWLWSLLYKIGLFQKNASVLFLGLDNAGKSTLLHKLKTGQMVSFVPTQRALSEQVVVGNVKFKAWDVGGHEAARYTWQEFFPEVDAVVFMVDSADHDRFDEAKQELHALLNQEELLQNVPFLILGNKADLSRACKPDVLSAALSLPSPFDDSDPHQRKLKLFPCSLVNGTGYEEAFSWLGDIL